MIRIMFVCHGNICRSTMAEFVMKDMVVKAGLQEHFLINSSATSTEEIGNDTHWGTKEVLDAHGIPYARRRAVQLKKSDADLYDWFIGMDGANVRNMERILGARNNPAVDDKIHYLLEFAGEERAIADPWYTGDFERTYEDVVDGCTGLLHFLVPHVR